MSYDFNILPVADLDETDAAPQETAYDTVWTLSEVPTQEPEGIERLMLAEDKLFVVLAVVLVIWFGIVALIWRTDSRLARLEQEIDESVDNHS